MLGDYIKHVFKIQKQQFNKFYYGNNSKEL